MSPLRFTSAALLVSLLAALAACGDAPRYDALPGDAVVLAFGDSVTHGTGASRGEDYPSVLAVLSGWEVVNAGIPGDTAHAATARITGELADARPHLVLIALGGNDFLRQRSAADVKEDLRTLIRAVQAADALPVLVSVPHATMIGAVTGRLSDSPIYAELAAEERVLLIDGVFARVLSEAALRADRIHPNAAGYRVMAEHIAEELARAGLLRCTTGHAACVR